MTTDYTARADIVALQSQMQIVTRFLSEQFPDEWGTPLAVTDAELEAFGRTVMGDQWDSDNPKVIAAREVLEASYRRGLEAAKKVSQEYKDRYLPYEETVEELKEMLQPNYDPDLSKAWVAAFDEVIGFWYITEVDGDTAVLDLIASEELAQHVVKVHNESLEK